MNQVSQVSIGARAAIALPTGVDVEREAAKQIRQATDAFDPRFYSWTAGSSPIRYVTQLRDVVVALLDRIDANRSGERSAPIAAEQEANLTLLASAFAQLNKIPFPRNPPDRFIGTRKVPHWPGSVWKDTYEDYERYRYNTQPVAQFSNLDKWLEATKRFTRDGTNPEDPAYVRKAVYALADGVAGVNASGLQLTTSRYSIKVGGWNH